MPQLLKIRYNTQHNGSPLVWRVIIDNKEYLASEIHLHVPSYTTVDQLPDGIIKHHVSALYEKITWEGTLLIVE